MGAEGDTAGGEVVYLLTELRSDERGPVHEIGSRARLIGADGDRLMLAVACGGREEVVTCPSGLVALQGRSLAARRRLLRTKARTVA